MTLLSIVDKFSASYSFLGAGLSHLQTYPQWTSTIFKIQRALMLVDFGVIIVEDYHLYLKEPVDQNRKIKKAALFLLSGLAVLAINAYVKPTPSLSDTTTRISWSSPWSYKLLQLLSINRLFITLGSSSYNKFHLISAALQSFTLLRISQLRWLQVEYHSRNTEQFHVQKLIANAWFIIPSSCTHFESVARAASTYVGRLVNTSTWQTDWLILVGGKQMFYRVKLALGSVDPCASCALIPKLFSITLSGLTDMGRRALIKLSY